MNFGLYDEYYMLKLVIALLLITLIIITGTLFYRLYRDRLLKDRKKNMIVRINSLLDNFLAENEERTSQNALIEIKSLYLSDKYFVDLFITELKRKLDKDENNIEYRDLYNLLGGPKVTRNKLISKNPIIIYQGLQEADRFDLLSEKEIISRLQNHRDIRISLLASCIVFKYKNDIKATDILNLESILCPMVEIKIFNEFRRRSLSLSGKSNIINVINDCLKLEISDKMRSFLNKSLKMIDA